MLLLTLGEIFNAKDLLLGENEWTFLFEVMVRAVVMFIVVLTSLHILGKRGVRQLSVFELVIILTLGSAAGDPMFYRDVGLLPCVIVFVMVVSLYRLVIFVISRNEKFKSLVEGDAVYLIKEGRFSVENFKKQPLAITEFFAELRLQNISQLGQVRAAMIETSGEISVIYYEDTDVRHGLPIMPDSLKKANKSIGKAGPYSCTSCGNTETLEPISQHSCSVCKKDLWIGASAEKRVS